MSLELECPTCQKAIAHEAYPFHALGHRVDKVSQDLKHMGEQVGEQVGKLPDTLAEAIKGIQPDPKLVEGLTALKASVDDVGAWAHAYHDPQVIEAHIKDCPTCRQKWEPYFTKPEPKPEPAPAPVAPVAPAAPPTSAAPKRLSWPTEADVPGSAPSQGAYRVERHQSEDGVGLRVQTEETGKAATEAGVVPRCRWVKGEDGYHYACEGG